MNALHEAMINSYRSPRESNPYCLDDDSPLLVLHTASTVSYHFMVLESQELTARQVGCLGIIGTFNTNTLFLYNNITNYILILCSQDTQRECYYTVRHIMEQF